MPRAEPNNKVSVYAGSNPSIRNIFIYSDWLKKGDCLTFELKDGYVIVKKHYLERPNKCTIYNGHQYQMSVKTNIPIGTYPIKDEDLSEDELIFDLS